MTYVDTFHWASDYEKPPALTAAAPVNYVSRSEGLDRFSGHDKFSSQKHGLYIAGSIFSVLFSVSLL
ncbi:MAG: hypothetical protein U9R57_11030 [Thermodesulfobacteriota bacterium]|nr:hypothetical protein [Thermodesulfobacteriota bacterium]